MRVLALYCSLAFIFVIPFESIAQFSGTGTLGRAVGLLAGAVWLSSVAVTGRLRQPHPFHIFAILFVLWNGLSSTWTLDFELTLDRAKTYGQLLLLSYMLWDLYDSKRALNAALQAYVLGAYITVAGSVHNYLSGVEAAYQRYTGAGFNSDEFGLILALGVPIAWYLNLSGSSGGAPRMLRLLNYLFLPAAFFGIALSGTRTAIVASLPSVIYMLSALANVKLSMRMSLALFLVCAALVLQPLIPEASVERLSTIGSELTEGDLNGRLRIWSEGFYVYFGQPLTGVGSAAYPVAVEVGKVAHNSYLSVLVETGMIGFLLFATMLALVVGAAFTQLKAQSHFWLAVIAVWALGALVLSIEHRKQTWLLLNLAICSSCLLIRAETDRRDTDLPTSPTSTT